MLIHPHSLMRGMKMKKLLPLTCLLAALSVWAPAQAADLANIRRIISDPKSPAAPGCVAGAFRDGRTLFVTAAGLADVDRKLPLNGDTLLYAASVSKQFTALAAAKLVERGKIRLDDDVRKYLPELPQYEHPVTIRMLMQHTAGIRDTLELLRLSGGIDSIPGTKKNSALQLLLRQKSTNFPPGTAYSYSNGGYLLLAEIIERVAGMPFADFAGRVILKPLRMNRSFFLNDARPAGENVAHGYVPDGENFKIRDTYPSFSGSGGLMTTINDFAKFERDIAVGHKVWTALARKIILTPGTLTNGKPALEKRIGMVYGGGVFMGHLKGQYFVEHGGSAEAFTAMYARLPERKIGVALFCNRGDWNPQDKAEAIIEAVEGDILTDTPAPPPAAPVPSGRYFSDELEATYDVSIAGDILTARLSSPFASVPGATLEFKRTAEGWLGMFDTRLVFDPGGKSFTINSGRIRNLHFRKLDVAKESSP